MASSSSSSSYISSTLRVSGLVSGIDVDSIVSNLMKAERTKVDKLYQQKQLVEWQQEMYRDLNLKLKSLYDNVFNMKLQGTYLKYKASGTLSSGTSADVYFTATPGSAASSGDYTVQVKALATSAQLTSSNSITKALTGDAITFPVTVDSTKNKFVMSVGGVEKTVTVAEGTYNDIDSLKVAVQSAVDKALGEGKVTVGTDSGSLTFSPADGYNHNITITLKDYSDSAQSILGALGFSDGDSYSEININSSISSQITKFKNNPGDQYKFTIYNGDKSAEFTFDSSATINDILKAISSNENINVTATYDTLTDKIVIKTKDTGESASIKIENTEGNLFGPSSAFNIASGEIKKGTNSKIVFSDITVENQSNSFTLNGIQFNLKQVMTETATLKVEYDTDTVVEKIKSFISQYNDTISAINEKLSEERYYDYSPLTDAQKEEMTEKQIEAWEEKAKSGLLRSDTLLMGIINKMRQAIYTPVSGLSSDMDTLSEIGITTGTYQEKGKLYLDEDKLKEALAKDPEAVMKLFTASDDSDSSKNGVAVKLYDILKSGIDSITDKAGGGDYQLYDNSTLGKTIRDLNDRISDMEDHLKEVEESYYDKFTQLEEAIAYYNQQSLWLSQQLGLGSS
ncbi:MAG: flagellar hook-associated protein 2 [Tepidanaerobacteraceae bacterium]|nr:flagellar hook-associated protein 2 [Tepidanaerobacteraceae bacterium]